MTPTHATHGDATGVLIRTALVTGLLLAILPTDADPDLWGHVRFGLDILRQGLPAADTYSFTTDRSWHNHEWLSEILMASAYRAGGALGLVALKGALVAVACFLMGWLLKRCVAPGWPRTFLFVFLLLLGVMPLTGTMRPNAFSLVLFTGLMVVLSTADEAPRRLGWLPLIFLLWVNLHGGWIAGLGVLAVWSAARILRPGAVPRWAVATSALLSVAATLINPYGIEMWHFVYSTVGIDRHDIVEWLPISRNRILLLPWSLTTVVAAWAAWRAPRTEASRLTVCALLTVLSFQVSRLIGFYGLAVGLLLVPTVLAAAPRTRDAPPVGLARSLSALTAGLIVLLWLGVQRPALACLPPAFALDPAASALLRAQPAGGRLVVYFDWGEYAIWHLAPRFRVSLDGRRETVYSDAILTAHQALWNDAPAAREILTGFDPDFVWIPSGLPLNEALRTWGWQAVVETDVSTLWLPPGADLQTHESAPPLPPCFPGP